MATRVDAGLSTDDLAALRTALEAGRRPKVMFTEAAGQIAGQFGQVAGVEEADGETTVVVRFGRDELPFTPADVVIPPRGAATAAKKAASAARATVPEVEEPAVPSGAPLLPPAPRSAPVETPVEGERPVRRPKAAKVKPAAGLTVTVSCVDGEWSVAAAQGSRTLAKPCAIRPAEALRVVALLDVPALSEAVEQIVAAERSRAAERVERLRAELAEVEARLAELPSGA
ncbi:hypothetical protein GCM10010123_43060 [Pilimelia anulata]|uniref:Uncharacterized protein n=1 Tax=Pilimelia anulata TaxID=53371 RepID=A0A8J3BEC7_9ACTN|nr:DUF6319 family protein [Pilimelia anulata]GGK08518.1 hypothetical protein GCM10010123_43060 [Pilimelia anulata]